VEQPVVGSRVDGQECLDDVGVDALPRVELSRPLALPPALVGGDRGDVRLPVEGGGDTRPGVVDEQEEMVDAAGQVAGHELLQPGHGVLDRADREQHARDPIRGAPDVLLSELPQSPMVAP
jgi:hypothetical protein